MPESRCRTVLIEDAPSRDDGFGAHARVAAAIEEVVRSESGGRAIALEGTWGSGKSTIVELLKKRLPGQVLVFDAWAHQGDPLRRVFLERLIAFHKGRIDRKRWDDELAKLAHRLRVEKSSTTPRLTSFGTLFAFFLLLVPVGGACLSVGINPQFPKTEFNWQIWAGCVLLALLPLLLALGLLAPLIVWTGGRIVSWFTDRRPRPLEFAHLAVFLNRTETSSHVETQQTPEPTSREFETIFSQLMTEALSRAGDRFILVIDNLDRVPEDDALSIWATLRVFLELCQGQAEGWSSRVWLLVPYDRPALKMLWHGNDGLEADSQSADVSHDRLGTAFLDKTFQVRFRVPPLLLGDWLGYLQVHLAHAFPDHNPAEFYDVARLYQLWFPTQGRSSPTPREIKLYVNDIGALHRQWQDQLPLAHLAYFVILGRLGVDIPASLVAGTIPGVPYDAVLDRDVVDSLTALFFNTDREKARTLLYRNLIEDALRKGEGDNLRKMANSDGFIPAFGDALLELPKTWQSDARSLANAAKAIEESGLLGLEKLAVLRREVRRFYAQCVATASWPRLDQNMVIGLGAMMRVLNQPNHTARIVQQVIDAETMVRKNMAEPHLDYARLWAGSFVLLLEQVTALGHSDALPEAISLPGSPAAFVQSCIVIAAHRQETRAYWHLFRAGQDVEGVVTSLLPKPDGTPWPADLADAIDVMVVMKQPWPWAKFCNQAVQVLQSMHEGADAESASRVVATLGKISATQSEAKSALDHATPHGYLHHHLQVALQQKKHRAAAQLLGSICAVMSPTQQPPANGQAHLGYRRLQQILEAPEQEPEVIRSLAELIIEAGWSQPVLRLLEVTAARPLLRHCLGHMGSDRRLVTVLNARTFVDHHSHLSAVMRLPIPFNGADWQAVLKTLMQSLTFPQELTDLAFNPKHAAIYTELGIACEFGDERYTTWCRSGLQQLSKDQWLSDFNGGGHALGLLMETRKRHKGLRLDDAYLDAMCAHGKALLSGLAAPKWNGDADVFDALDAKDRRVLRRNLRDELVKNPSGNESFLAAFGDEIAMDRSVLEFDGLFRNLLTPLVERRSAAAAEWAVHVLQTHPRLLSASADQDADIDDLKGRVRTALDETDDAALRPKLRELAACIGLELPRRGKAKG